MSWFNDILTPIKNFTNDLNNFKSQVGELVSGFGGLINSRSDLFDQIDLGTPSTATEAIQLISNSIATQRDPYATLPVLYNGPLRNYDRRMQGRVLGLQLAEISSSGTDRRYLHLTYWICYGPIQALDLVDTTVEEAVLPSLPTDLGLLRSFTFTNSTRYQDITMYDGYARVYVNAGDIGNTHSPSWSADTRVYPGIAHVKIRLEYPVPDGETEFPDSVPTQIPTWQWHVWGINPTQLTTDTAPTRSRRALFLYDYLTNRAYGRGIPEDQLDKNSFGTYYTIVNRDDATTDDPNLSEPDLNNSLFYLDGAASVGSNIATMLTEMQAALIFKRGKFYLRPSNNILYYSANTNTSIDAIERSFEIANHTITDADIIGGVNLNLTPPLSRPGILDINTTEYKYYLGETVEDGEIVYNYYPEQRTLTIDAKSNYPERTTELSYNLQGDEDTTSALALWASATYANTMQLTVGSRLLNVDVYDRIRVYSRTLPSLNGRYYQVTDARINPDLTVAITAREIQLERDVIEEALKENFLYDELYASEDLRKYIYDLPASTVGDISQFEIQEPDSIALGRERLEVDAGGGAAEPVASIATPGRSPVCPLSNLNMVASVSYEHPTALSSDYTITVRAYNSFNQLVSLNPNQPSAAGICGIRTIAGTGASAYQTYLLLQQNQTYRISIEVANSSGFIVASQNYTHTTPAASGYSAISTWHLTTIRQDMSPLPSDAQFVNIFWNTFTAVYSGQVNTVTQSTALTGSFANKIDTPLLFEFTDLSDSCSTFQPQCRITANSGSGDYTYLLRNGLTQSTAGNVKLARSYGFLTGSQYDLTLYQRQMLLKLGRSDLVYD